MKQLKLDFKGYGEPRGWMDPRWICSECVYIGVYPGNFEYELYICNRDDRTSSLDHGGFRPPLIVAARKDMNGLTCEYDDHILSIYARIGKANLTKFQDWMKEQWIYNFNKPVPDNIKGGRYDW